MTNHQRKGVSSNTQVGREFESKAIAFFSKQGLSLQPKFKMAIGVEGREPNPHEFDLGNEDKKVIIECKSHTWTESWNVPSAKMTTWDQAMFYFNLASIDYRKIMFALRHFNPERKQTLAEYYITTHKHLIPDKVEIWEYDEKTEGAIQLSMSE